MKLYLTNCQLPTMRNELNQAIILQAFFISNTFISNVKLKIKQKLSNTLKLNFWQKCLNKQVGNIWLDYMINCNENENDHEKYII